MNSKAFIVAKLEELITQYSYLGVRYECVTHDDSHYIEVLPLSAFEKDSSYIAYEEAIYASFSAQFPNESICFFSEDALYTIEQPIYTKKGITYGLSGLIAPIDKRMAIFEPSIDNIKVAFTNTTSTILYTQSNVANAVIVANYASAA